MVAVSGDIGEEETVPKFYEEKQRFVGHIRKGD